MSSGRRLPLLRVALLAVATLSGAGWVGAQESMSDASIAGRVIDPSPSGGALPGAIVTARHVDTNATVSATADAEGRFRFSHLRVGRYQVVVTLPGFSPSTATLVATAGSAFDLTMTLGTTSLFGGSVIVAEDAVIETARTQVAGTISRAEVDALPLNGRNFLDIALLVPGVAPANVGGTALVPETSAVPGVGLSVGSQRNFSNSFIVDGLSANDDAAGLSGITYGVDAIDQVQVVTSGGQAEFGRALGGYVNVVTRSGTNTLTGSVFNYLRDDSLNARNTLSRSRLPMRQWQYGATVGGPVARDRAFFLGSAEQRHLDQSGLVTITEGDAAAINARLAAVGYGGPPVATGLFDNPFRATNVVAKLDYQTAGADRWTVRYSGYDASAANSRGAGALNTASASAGLLNRDSSLTLSHVHVVTPQTVLETRAQVALARLSAPPSDIVGPAVSIAGVAIFGTLSGSPTKRDNTLMQAVSSVTWMHGAHVARAGVDFQRNDLTITFPRSVRGSYGFASLESFLVGTYSNSGFSQTFGDQAVTTGNPNLGVYVQDEWRIASRVTLNAGLRYDLQWLETIQGDRNNTAPRLGLAWRPWTSDRTIVRGNAGLFFDRVPLRALSNALLSAGNTTDLSKRRQVTISLSPAQVNAPVFPNILPAAVPSTALVNLTTMDRRLQNARSAQVSVEIEQQLTARSTASVAFERLRGSGLIASINQNVPTCVASGSNNGCRPNGAYANNSQYSAAGRSTYDALHVSWTLRPNASGSYRVSYAYSKSMNDVGEAFFNGPIDPTDISKDWGRSDEDQRHRLVATAAIRTSTTPATTPWQHLTHGVQLSGMLQAYSAPPFNITSGVTTIQGTTGRPIVNGAFIERNAGVGSAFVSIGIRASRSFVLAPHARIEILAEIFNLTNHANVVSRNTNFGAGAYPSSPAANFGQVTAVGEPRSGQLGVRLSF